MVQRKQYYRLEEAEALKQTYSGWINKMAHVGNGQQDILKRIIVKPIRSVSSTDITEKKYAVKFEFVSAVKIDACNFLINNGLAPAVTTRSDRNG